MPDNKIEQLNALLVEKYKTREMCTPLVNELP